MSENQQREVEPAPGLRVPTPVKAQITEGSPYDLDMVVEYVGGKFVCTSLTAKQREGGEPVTGEGLRKLPVSRYVSQVVRMSAWRVSSEAETASSWVPLVETWGDPREFSKRGPVDDVLREVAAVYRLAFVLGDPPLKRVQETFGLPRSTASRWAAAPREKEFLGASEGRGKAGGVHFDLTSPDEREKAKEWMKGMAERGYGTFTEPGEDEKE